MNETLYRWTFNFHKVVRQQNSGAVEDFILPYPAVYLRIQEWKNYWNRSTFAKIIVKIKVARFLWPTVYIPKSSTLDDLERPWTAKTHAGAEEMRILEPTAQIWTKIDPYYQRQNVGQWLKFLEM